jgi:hypothetical protein
VDASIVNIHPDYRKEDLDQCEDDDQNAADYEAFLE